MGLLSFFTTEMNQSLVICKKTVVRNADYTIDYTFTDDATVSACIYSKAMAEKYFGTGLWKEDVVFVAVVNYPLNATVFDHARFNGTTYAIDSIDNVAFQNDVLLVGLRGIS